MSMTAEVTCIGIYRPELVGSMPYPPEFYKDTRTGSVVIAKLLHADGSQGSHSLAEALGVDPRDFSTHSIRRRQIKWEALAQLFDAKDVEDFRRLVYADFIVIYTPDF